MANKAAYLEKAALNTWLRALTTAVSGSNASAASILVTSSTGYNMGDVVQLSTPGSLHRVTSIPDGTHIGITPSAAVAPTTGNVVRIAYAPPGVWLALFTAAPTDAGGGTEAAYAGYARVQVTQADASWAAPSGTPSSTSNSGTITFPASTGAGSTLTHFGWMDAASGGNLLAWNALGTSQAVGGAGVTPTASPGVFTWAED